MAKQYGAAEDYEGKLARVMERFGVGKYNYNWDRFSAFVEFWLKDQMYRFDHSVEKCRARGFNIRYGSDVFAQLVLALQDLARMTERGIYELQTWLVGMKYLPPPIVIPEFIKALGFKEIPESVNDIQARYRTLAQQLHPDKGGSHDAFIALKDNAEKAIEYLNNKGN